MSSAGQQRFTGTTVIGTARLIAAKDLRGITQQSVAQSSSAVCLDRDGDVCLRP